MIAEHYYPCPKCGMIAFLILKVPTPGDNMYPNDCFYPLHDRFPEQGEEVYCDACWSILRVGEVAVNEIRKFE